MEQSTNEVVAYDLGMRIRRLRQLRGLKQRELANMIGITQTGLSKIESGGTDLSLKKATNIAAIFELSLIDFLLWQDPEPLL